MWKKITLTTIILLLYLLTCALIYTTYKNTSYIERDITHIEKENPNIPIPNTIANPRKEQPEKPIGKIAIEKINLYETIYDINSPRNNIEEHVTILKQSEDPSVENSTFFLAAHSGTGYKAFFNHLDRLQIDDQIILEYKNKTYHYKVKNIWKEKKSGTIKASQTLSNQLILTTCHPTEDDYQLIISSILQK